MQHVQQTIRKRDWLTGGAIVTAASSCLRLKLIMRTRGRMQVVVRLLDRNRLPIFTGLPANSLRDQIKMSVEQRWPNCVRMRRLRDILGNGDYTYGSAAVSVPPALWEASQYFGIGLRLKEPNAGEFPRGQWQRAADTIYVEVNQRSLFRQRKIPRRHHCLLMTRAQIDARIDQLAEKYHDVFGCHKDINDMAYTNIYLKLVSGLDHPLVTESLQSSLLVS